MGHLNTHNRLHNRRVQDLEQDAQATLVSVVYVTMSATFTGATAGYKTLTGSDTSSTAAAAAESTSETKTKKKTSATSSADSSSATSDAETSSAAAQTTSTTAAATTATSTSATASATSTLASDSSSSSSSSGLSGGAKAGIAIVVILLVALLLAAALFFVRKKKQQQKQQEMRDNEKSTSGFTQLRETTTNTPAPRLSLRPVTQFLPMLGAVKTPEVTEMHNEKELRPGSNSSTNSANPFGHSAEQIDRAANAPIPVSQAPIPPAKPAPSAGLGLAGGTAAGMANRSPPQARGPPPGNVHRVQLDFLPSMEDELELRAGQLVRVLHEYDDGWALCVYMDRSKQGVAPRTCLSQNPLKPRPNGPPPGMAPMRPQSPQMRPQSPGMRSQSPGMRNFSGPPPSASRDPLYPAPLSPSLPIMRTGSPGPHSPQAAAGRQRSYSQSQSRVPPFNPGPQNGSPVRDHRRSVSMTQLGNTSPSRGVPSRKPLPGM